MKCAKMATFIMATSTSKLIHPFRLAHLTHFARPSLKMRLASLGRSFLWIKKNGAVHAHRGQGHFAVDDGGNPA